MSGREPADAARDPNLTDQAPFGQPPIRSGVPKHNKKRQPRGDARCFAGIQGEESHVPLPRSHRVSATRVGRSAP